jgi:Leucine-rich repeat (LRR) protein
MRACAQQSITALSKHKAHLLLLNQTKHTTRTNHQEKEMANDQNDKNDTKALKRKHDQMDPSADNLQDQQEVSRKKQKIIPTDLPAAPQAAKAVTTTTTTKRTSILDLDTCSIANIVSFVQVPSRCRLICKLFNRAITSEESRYLAWSSFVGNSYFLCGGVPEDQLSSIQKVTCSKPHPASLLYEYADLDWFSKSLIANLELMNNLKSVDMTQVWKMAEFWKMSKDSTYEQMAFCDDAILSAFIQAISRNRKGLEELAFDIPLINARYKEASIRYRKVSTQEREQANKKKDKDASLAELGEFELLKEEEAKFPRLRTLVIHKGRHSSKQKLDGLAQMMPNVTNFVVVGHGRPRDAISFLNIPNYTRITNLELDSVFIDCHDPLLFELCPLLERLVLCRIKFSSFQSECITSIARLKHLKRLVCINCGMGDMKYLKDANSNIQELFVQDALSSLTHVTNLSKNLTRLEIRDDQVIGMVSLTPVMHLANLKKLNIEGYDVMQNLKPLAHLQKLEALEISSREEFHEPDREAMESIAKIKSLRSLSLHHAQIRCAWPLTKLYNLVHLNLHACSIKDLSVFSQMESLETLNLCGNGIFSMEPLVHCVKLTHLDLSCNDISCISRFVYKLTKLRVLNVKGNHQCSCKHHSVEGYYYSTCYESLLRIEQECRIYISAHNVPSRSLALLRQSKNIKLVLG